MTDPKLRVSADVSGVLSELNKVQAQTEKINKTLNSGQVGIDAKEAKADLAALERLSKSLASQLENVARAGDELSGVDLDSVTRSLSEAAKAAGQLDTVLEAVGQSSGMAGTVRGAAATADHLNRAVKAHRDLGAEGRKYTRDQIDGAKRAFDQWRRSGARGTGRIQGQEFDDWIRGGWRGSSLNEGDARRERNRIMNAIGLGGSDDTAAARRLGRMNRLGSAAGAIGGILGSMTSGGDGGMWSGIGGGAGGLLGAGAGALFGGPVGMAVGAFSSRLLGGLGGSIDGAVGRVGDESAIYTDLRQSLGQVNVDFNLLRGSMRNFSDELGIAYGESAKLAKEFAHTANVSGDHASSLAKDVAGASSFGRGYGIAPEAAVQFFAQMRHLGQTSNERDTRRLALQIGEAVNRGGTSSKMDEVLSAIQSFTQNATRQSMTAANVEEYASLMARLTGGSFVGMKGDPGAAAAAIGTADASLRRGGGFGEASKVFTLGMLQEIAPNISALDAQWMHEQGAMGTIRGAYGRDSAAWKSAFKAGDTGLMDKYDSIVSGADAKGLADKSHLELQMDKMRRMSGGNTDMMRQFAISQFGWSSGQFAAMMEASNAPGGLGSLEKTLGGAGINMSGLNEKQIATLASLAGSDDSGIRKQASRLIGLKGVSANDRADLEGQMKNGSPEELRKMVLKMTELYDTTKDDGQVQRELQAKMANSMSDLATKLVPLTMTIQEGIVELVRHFAGGDSDVVKRFDAEKEKERADSSRAASLEGSMKGVRGQIDAFREDSPDSLSQKQAAIASLKKAREAAATRGDSASVAAFDNAIKAQEASIRAGSSAGLDDLYDKYNSMAAERNSISGVSGSFDPLVRGSGGPQGGGYSNSLSGDKSKPRNLRNNNPGNIVFGDFARRHGATGSDGRFAIFPDAETGSRAMDALLGSYQNNSGLKTLRQIIGKWAPSNENDTNSYVANVAKRLGVSPDAPIDMNDPKIRSALAREMSRMEGAASAYVDGKVPGGANPGGNSQKLNVTVGGELTVVGPDGRRTGQSVAISQVGPAIPAGVRAAP